MSVRRILILLSLLLALAVAAFILFRYFGGKSSPESELNSSGNLSLDSALADYRAGLPFQMAISDSVMASLESDTIPAQPWDDAADDPAIWVHPGDPSLSTILLTNKKGGIAMFDLSGKLLQYLEGDAYNNVDIRSGVSIGNNESIVLVAASNISNNGITFFRISEGPRKLIQFGAPYLIDTAITGGVYGISMGRDLRRGRDYVVVNGQNGTVLQFELKASPDGVTLNQRRKFRLESRAEGMVVDDEQGYLYIAEEKKGIWKYRLDPGDISVSMLTVSDSAGTAIRFDLEGLAIYYAAGRQGYLIASSQGNSSFALFERSAENTYIGSFKVSAGQDIDGVENTDGIDVCNLNLGPAFPNGLLVLQDGYNFQNGRLSSQNLKFVAWDAVATALSGKKVIIDNSFRVR
jgi:3-phytase